MAALDDITAQIPITDLAAKLGVDEHTARTAVNEALPALLGGMGANAADPAGAASLEKAVQQHSPSLVEGGVNLDDVDEGDGEKIVRNVFGGNTDQVVQKLGEQGGGGGSNVIQQLLPVLAPIVMSFLAKQFQQKQAPAAAPSAEAPAAEQGGGIGDLLGGLLGGLGGAGSAQGQPAQPQASASDGGLLGNLGGIGDLLGGLLGAGKR